MAIADNYDKDEFEIEGNELLKYKGKGGDVVIPDGVEKIASAFHDNTKAFKGRDDVLSVTLPKSLKLIAAEAFDYCHNLKKVYYSGSLAEWCALKFQVFACPLQYGAELYCNGELISDLVIPDGVTEIGNMQFEGGAFKSVTIPSCVEVIGNNVFNKCKSIERLVIERGVRKIGDSAFAGCENIKKIILPDGVESVDKTAFSHCKKLERAYIPASVAKADAYLFIGCGGDLVVECEAKRKPKGWHAWWNIIDYKYVLPYIRVNKRLKKVKWGVTV